MSQVFEYNGFLGSAEVSLEDGVLFGTLLYINDLITYEAQTLQELEVAFKEAVEDYVEFCDECGKLPEKPFKGSFNVRVSPEEHRAAAYEATKRGITFNQFIRDAIRKELNADENNSREYEEISSKLDKVESTVNNAVVDINNNFAAGLAANTAFILKGVNQNV